MTTGVAAGSFWFAPVYFDFSIVNMGGGGSPSQPRSRNETTSWKIVLARWSLFSSRAGCTHLYQLASHPKGFGVDGVVRIDIRAWQIVAVTLEKLEATIDH